MVLHHCGWHYGVEEKKSPAFWYVHSDIVLLMSFLLIFISYFKMFKIRHECDSNCWGPGPEGCEQTLLFKAIDENNECVACFLIRR